MAENLNSELPIRGIGWTIYKIVIVLTFFGSMHSYFFFHFEGRWILIAFSLVSAMLILTNPKLISLSKSNLMICLLFIVAYWYTAREGNLNYYISVLLASIPISSMFLLKDVYKIDLINKFHKYFAYFVGISAVAYLVNYIGISLPTFPDFYGTAAEGSGLEHQYIYVNHILFLENAMRREVGEFSRFGSVFLEPGYFAIIIVFLLYIGKFDFSKTENKIYFFTLLCTLSLAGYIMLFGAYFAHTFSSRNKMVLIRLSVGALFAIAFFAFFTNYNDGDNVVNEALLKRIEWDEEKDNISGYNRTNEDIDDEFISLWSTSYLMFGKGTKAIEFGMSVGYKPYMLMHGLFGLGILLFSIYYVYRQRRCYDALIMFLLFVAMFARGHHVVFWQGYWMLYVCGVAKLYADKRTKELRKYNFASV